jgi:hypothetical protein
LVLDFLQAFQTRLQALQVLGKKKLKYLKDHGLKMKFNENMDLKKKCGE